MHKPARSKGVERQAEHLRPYFVRAWAENERKLSTLMLDDYGFEKFEENQFPLAYLITFRTYATWLHGDERGAFSRQDRDRFGSRFVQPSEGLRSAMKKAAGGGDEVLLDDAMREVVDAAIREICDRRGYRLLAVNVRTNHVHAVVASQRGPERIANELKANATKRLRDAGLALADGKVWSRGRSRRYLWKPRHVEAAIEYVLYAQGDVPFEIG